MTLRTRLRLAATFSTLSTAAYAQAGPRVPGVAPFDSVFQLVRRVPLTASAQEPVGVVQTIAVSGDLLYVVDGSNGNVKLFDIASGRLLRMIGRAGDRPGEMRRVVAIVVDSAGLSTTIDYGRQVLVRWDAAGRVIEELRLPGQWSGLAQVATRTERRIILVGRTGILTREGGIPVDSAPPVLHELGPSGIVRSFYPVAWPQSSWRRSFTNFIASGAGSVLATGGYATAEVRFRDWSTGREWTDTLRAPWLNPIEWPVNEQFGAGSKMTQMREWLKQQTLTNNVFLGSPRWYVAQVQLQNEGYEPLYGYIVSTTDGRRRTAVTPTKHKILHVRGELSYMLTEDEAGNYVLEVRRVRMP